MNPEDRCMHFDCYMNMDLYEPKQYGLTYECGL